MWYSWFVGTYINMWVYSWSTCTCLYKYVINSSFCIYTRSTETVVPENGTEILVIEVEAIDDDIGDDGVLSYSIVNVTQNNMSLTEYPFAINSTTGAITTTELLSQLLDEGSYSYVITVLVSDMGTPPKISIASYSVVFIGTYIHVYSYCIIMVILK